MSLGRIEVEVGRAAPGPADLDPAVGAVLTQLKPIDWEVLWMRHFDQLSFADLAMLLKIPENTANKRHARALRRLKDLLPDLDPQGDEGP
jgi:DNA-directed RNA polymerase specialized sigma24 family protein